MPSADRITKQLAEVTRNRLGRFARVEYLRTCDPIAGCAVDADLAEALEGVDAFLETVEQLVLVTDPAEARELAQVVRDYRQTLRDDLEALEDDAGDGDPDVLRRPLQRSPMWVEGLGVGEAMDVTGLTGKEAATLALVLHTWSGKKGKRSTPTYSTRGGRRYIRGPSRLRVDLNHPQMEPFRDDILAAMRDPDGRREFDVDWDAFDAFDPDAFGAEYDERLRAQAREARDARRAARGKKPPTARKGAQA